MTATRTGGTRAWAIDLVLVTVLVLGAWAALLVPGIPWPIEWAFGVPLLLVLPGYVLVAVLFPRRPADDVVTPSITGGGPDWLVRIALSFVLSAVVVAVIGVLLSAVESISLAPVVIAIGAFTIAGAELAAFRRLRCPPEARAGPFSGGVQSAVGGVFGGTTLQTVATLLAVGALVTVLVYAGMVPTAGESYSEFAVLHENEDGELVAADYPTTFVAGEGHSLHLAVENHERQTVSYTVVMVAESVGDDGTATDRRELDRFGVELDTGERTVVERTVAPQRTGDDVRLRFLLYEGAVPDEPSAESADLSTHLWVEVVEEEGG